MSQKAATWAEWAGATVDSVVSLVSPAWGARRQQDRILASLAVQQAQRVAKMAYHDGAEHDRLSSDRSWIGSQATTDDILAEDLPALQERSRELYRDDSIGGAVDQDLEHVVGTGFKLQAKPDPLDPAGFDLVKIAAEFERVIKRFSRRADPSGKKSLWKLSRLAWRCIRVDGACLTVMSAVPKPGKLIPLAVEVIDIWRLGVPPGQENNPRIRLGVEYDADVGGEIVAYWIRKAQPYDKLRGSKAQQFDRIPADRVIHVFDPWFAEQSGGYPWFTRVIQRIKDGKDIDFAGLVALQVQACFAAFVKSKKGNALKAAKAAATGTDAEGKRLQDIRPGGVHYVEDEVVFATPTAQNGAGSLQEQNDRKIAAGMNTPYEFLKRDWRGLSFAGGRLVLSGAKLGIRSGQKMMGEEWFAAIYSRAITEAVIFGAVSLPARIFSQDPDGWTEHKCTPQRFSYSVNPVQEIQADTMEVNANFCTLEEKIAERQGDLDEVVAQRGTEKKKLEKEGLLAPAAPEPKSIPKPPSKQVTP